MKRRTVLQSALAGSVALAAPRIGRGQGAKTITFVPQADLTSLDPVWTTADVTRNYSLLVFDTLYGNDANYQASPQMAAGHQVSEDKTQWDITLRDGLKFHDGSPVLARDCVATIKRWWQRDPFGGALAAATDEVSAPSDKVIRFRLKQPFALLPSALASYNSCIMPERIAATDAGKQIPEVIGSGPFRFLANERVTGSRVVFEKFAGYVPRPDGTPSFSAGPKVAYVDRVVWTTIPDPATASAALTQGEVDWWEQPTIDLTPMLKQDRNIVLTVKDKGGEIGCMRFNCLYPPFDNAAIRRVVVSAIDQNEFMQAVAGADPELIRIPVGIFSAGTPFATEVGCDVQQGAKDPAKLKQALDQAGYKGERVVVLAASDFPTINAEAEVGGDLLKRIGFNVDYQSLDWGTVVQRRASQQPPDQGGWNIFFTYLGGLGNVIPAANIAIRGNGKGAWFGWPTMPDIEALRQQWFQAPDQAAQKKVIEQLQMRFWQDAPYAPLGEYYQPTAFRSNLKDVPEGFPQFYTVKKT